MYPGKQKFENGGVGNKSIHHGIPSSEGGSNHAFNKIPLEVRLHRAIHLLYGNNLPHLALQILLNMFVSVYKEAFKDEVNDLLTKYPESEIYRPEVLTKKFYNTNGARRK